MLIPVLLVSGAALSIPTATPETQPAVDPTVLHVDPLLVAQAEEIWRHIAVTDNAIWPGWAA